MLSAENDNFICFFLLVLKGGTKLLKMILETCLRKESKTIDELLASHPIEQKLRRSRQVNASILLVLYPKSPDIRNVTKWDIALLSFVILKCLKKHLTSTEKLAVQRISDYRNKMSHEPDPAIDSKTFKSWWTDLVLIITTLSHGIASEDANYLTELIRSISNDLDLRVAVGEVKSLLQGSSEDIDNILRITEKLERLHLETNAKLDDVKEKILELSAKQDCLSSQNKRLLTQNDRLSCQNDHLLSQIDSLRQELKNLGKQPGDEYKLKVVAEVQADENTTKEYAESSLLEASNARLEHKTSDSSLQSIRTNVDDFIDDMEQEGNTLTSVRKGSVIFEFNCSSLDAMLHLTDSFFGSTIQEHLKCIKKSLEHIVGKNVDLDVYIPREQFRNILKRLDEMKQKRSVEYIVSCKGINGVEHIVNLFENGSACNSLNKLATSLSDFVGKPVRLEPSLELQVMEAHGQGDDDVDNCGDNNGGEEEEDEDDDEDAGGEEYDDDDDVEYELADINEGSKHKWLSQSCDLADEEDNKEFDTEGTENVEEEDNLEDDKYTDSGEAKDYDDKRDGLDDEEGDDDDDGGDNNGGDEEDEEDEDDYEDAGDEEEDDDDDVEYELADDSEGSKHNWLSQSDDLADEEDDKEIDAEGAENVKEDAKDDKDTDLKKNTVLRCPLTTVTSAAELDPTLEKKTFNNWLKGMLSVLFAKEGLSEFVQTEISDFQKDLINSVFKQNGIALGTRCGSCTTENLLVCPTANFCSKRERCNKHDTTLPNKTPNIKCQKSLCNGIQDVICKQHRFNQPSWTNTDATTWCSDPFEVAKCFLPPDGYSDKTSLADIDLTGMISIIINNKWFQNKMTRQDICSHARDIINENIRHSVSNELSDLQLTRLIDALRDVLRDSKFLLHDQHAQVAVNKLNQLQNNTLAVSADDISRAMEESTKDCLNQQQQEAVQAIKKYLDTAQTASVAAFECIESTVLDEIQKTADGKIKESVHLSQQQHTHNDDILYQKFKEDLIRFYNLRESTIPVSPLVADYAIPLTELYVQPPMSAFIKPSAFGQGNKPSIKKPVSSYRELFLKDDVPYKNIYLVADAGCGKTSFAKNIAVTWCQSPVKNKKPVSKFEDVDTLKIFDLVFLLHLRDCQYEDTCLLDEMILKFIGRSLPKPERFSDKFIKSLLRTRPCLILCDGLDEWTHPSLCVKRPEIPHSYGDKCTVITTSRPWKISMIGLQANQIDRLLEISTLDDETSKQLELNAVKLLGTKSGKEERDLTDFDKEVKTVKLGNIRLIPYILLQLVSIWLAGLSIGKAKCETYSTIIELTLKRGLKSVNAPTLPTGNAERNVTVPKCMRKNMLCHQYVNLLLTLGKFAFHSLLQKIKKSSLETERKTVMKFLTQQELEFCLKIGLLSQTKGNSQVSVKDYEVFFQHTSLQEFMAALYITSEWNNETIKLTICEYCSSLSRILEMENLFVFVCGMNPIVYACISGELQKIIDIDSVTRRYACRTGMYCYGDRRTIESYQSMQMQCLQESMRNENESCPIYLYVLLDNFLTDDELTALKTIIYYNEGNMNMLSLKVVNLSLQYQKNARFVQALDPGVFTCLEILRVEKCNQEPVWLADILFESARTLKCLTLSKCRCPLSDIGITGLKGLTCLQSLCLDRVRMTHSNLRWLYAYISQTTTLTQLKLNRIQCSDHKYQYRDCDAINRLNDLKILDIYNVPCIEP